MKVQKPSSRMKWYIQNRIEYLMNKSARLREQVLDSDAQHYDYELLREFMETKGRIKELKNVLHHLNNIGDE